MGGQSCFLTRASIRAASGAHGWLLSVGAAAELCMRGSESEAIHTRIGTGLIGASLLMSLTSPQPWARGPRRRGHHMFAIRHDLYSITFWNIRTQGSENFPNRIL